MAYQTITATNMEVQCGIQIQCIATGTAVGNVSSVVLKKRYTGTSTWKKICTVEIDSVDDFSFSYFDPDTRSGFSYDYIAIPVINNIEQVGVMTTCTCKFSGIYIADSTSVWVALYNCEYSKVKNTQVSYVLTLASKYPKRVSNASTNYYTGSVAGLFLPADYSGDPILEQANEYKNALLDFLCNGKQKLLKTYDGNAWVVSIDSNPKENFSRFAGASTISFSWTEIGELDYIPYKVDKYKYTQYKLSNGNVYVNGVNDNAGVSFTVNDDGTVTFNPTAQKLTVLSINGDNAELLEFRPDSTAPSFSLNSSGSLVVTY